MKHKKHLLMLVLALMLCMTGCMPEFVDINDYLYYEADPDRPVTRLEAVLTAEQVSMLDTEYPALEKLDLTGSTCYPEILAYVQSHPNVDVKYTVTILGKEYSTDTLSVNLSAMTADQIDTVGPMLQHLPDLMYVELLQDNGSCNLTQDEAKTLQAYVPKVPCNYAFELFGKRITTGDTVLELVDTPVYDSGLDQIRAAMKLMPNLKSVRLDNCGTTSETMYKFRTECAGIDVHWRVWFGRYTCMTDESVLRLTNGLLDEHIGELKYCIGAEYVDLGHNEYLTDISFFQYMPKVKQIIISGTNISDISPLKGLKNLEFLEAVFCTGITDVSALSECTGLKYLNISITSVKELDALAKCPLERFVALSMKNLTQAEREDFAAAHADCLRVWWGTQPYGYGWRYSDQGYTFYKYYTNMREIYDYDDKYAYTGKYYTGTQIQPA